MSIFDTLGDITDFGKDVADIYGGFKRPRSFGGKSFPTAPTLDIGASGDVGSSGSSGPAGDAPTEGLAGYYKIAGDVWRQIERMSEHPRTDVLTIGQPDDREFAKLLVARGLILADSDVGEMLAIRGAKPKRYSVALSDGRRVSLLAFPVGGADASRKRAKNWATPARRRDALRTLRAMLVADKRLAVVRKAIGRLAPKKRASAPAFCPPKKRARC